MAEMKLEVPQSVIKEIVQAQVVAALGKSEDLVRAVIEEAMKAPGKDQWGHQSRDQTLFQQRTAEMIRQTAEECFKEWLAEHKEEIRKAFRARLMKDKAAVLVSLADQLTAGVTNIYANLGLQILDRK